MRSQVGTPEIATHVRDKLVSLVAQWDAWDLASLGYVSPWPAQLAAFDAGEPVPFHAWQLPDRGRSIGLQINDHVLVDRYGRVSRERR